MNAIYLDYNATTPIHPDVFAAMLPFLREDFGNPSPNYPPGQTAAQAIGSARAHVAALIGAQPDEIIFTSCATESTNMAVRGAAVMDAARSEIVTSTIEHPATEACCAALMDNGHSVKRVACDTNGVLNPEHVADAITERTAVVTIIHAQNEIGTLQPIKAIARAAHESGALTHVDAAQSIGKIAVNVADLGIDLLTIAGHKLYAPKGIGALYVRRGLNLANLMFGAGQEGGRRPGTENTPYIVALGEACRLAQIHLAEGEQRMACLTKQLFGRLEREIPGLVLIGETTARLPNTLNVLFPNVSGQALLHACPEVWASTGSACHAGSQEPSAILSALGLPREKALGAVRLSISRDTSEEEIERAATYLSAAWRRVTEPQ